MSWAANQVIQFPQRELWTKSELRPEQKEKMVLEVNDCVVNEMSHMLFSVFRCSYTAYQYTTVSVKIFFTRTTRLGLCQITMSSKQPWKKYVKTKKTWCFLRGSWCYELRLFVAVWVCKATQQEQRWRLECQWGSEKVTGKWPFGWVRSPFTGTPAVMDRSRGGLHQFIRRHAHTVTLLCHL